MRLLRAHAQGQGLTQEVNSPSHLQTACTDQVTQKEHAGILSPAATFNPEHFYPQAHLVQINKGWLLAV